MCYGQVLDCAPRFALLLTSVFGISHAHTQFSSMIVFARDLRLRDCKSNAGFGLIFFNREEHG